MYALSHHQRSTSFQCEVKVCKSGYSLILSPYAMVFSQFYSGSSEGCAQSDLHPSHGVVQWAGLTRDERGRGHWDPQGHHWYESSHWPLSLNVFCSKCNPFWGCDCRIGIRNCDYHRVAWLIGWYVNCEGKGSWFTSLSLTPIYIYHITFQTVISTFLCCLASTCISFRECKSSSLYKLCLPQRIRSVVHQSSCLGVCSVFQVVFQTVSETASTKSFLLLRRRGGWWSSKYTRSSTEELTGEKRDFKHAQNLTYVTCHIILTFIPSTLEFNISNTLVSGIGNPEPVLI